MLSFAHQGGAREGPSSTLWAMRRALGAGADALELDVHMTADRHLVVCHDATLERTTNGTGRITELSLAEVQSLDNAYWWVPGSIVDHDADASDYPLRGRAPEDAELVVPTLDAVLAAFPDTLINLDIKQTAPAVEPYEERLAKVLRDHGRRAGDVIVASFHDAALDAFSAAAPEFPTAAGTAATAVFYLAVRQGEAPPASRHVALQVPPAYEGVTVVDDAFVAAAHEAGMEVHVWTIDEPAEMAELLDLGVDGIMTDRPSVLAGILAARLAADGTSLSPNSGPERPDSVTGR